VFVDHWWVVFSVNEILGWSSVVLVDHNCDIACLLWWRFWALLDGMRSTFWELYFLLKAAQCVLAKSCP